jgi:hypothetical protein
MSPEDRFEDLVEGFVSMPHVSPPSGNRGFGRNALRVRGKIFAMLVRGQLVVKLPKERVDALVDSGDGVRFDANKGKPMKEWLSLGPTSALDWEKVAGEALDFVSPG